LVVETHWKLLEVARALRRSGDEQQAFMAYCDLLLLHPEAIDAWTDYGDLQLSLNQLEDAHTAFANALAIDPDFPTALAGQGRVLLRRGRLEEAAVMLVRALTVDPRVLEVRLDLARCHWKMGHWNEALVDLGTAAKQEPGNPVVTRFLIDIYIRRGMWPELHQEMLRRANSDYSDAELAWELCCVNLLFGAMPLGWDQHEARWSHPGLTNPRREFPQPLWSGEPLAGRTILLHCEQGFGDTLMFVRYAPLVKQLGGKVLLLVQPELADLVATCPGVNAVFAEEGSLPHFDVHLPLLSLPYVFRTDLASIPADIPYLDVPARVPNRNGIRERLTHSQGRTRIGISWAGNPTHARDAQRSIPPEALLPLQALPDVAWFAFQHGMTTVPPLPGLDSLAPLLSNFSDSAYALSGMDLVITVDTALAHLAGALGIPTLLLVSYLPDWRWLMGRDDSPWYPSFRIYRQTGAGDWSSVIDQLLTDLTSGS
jgi:tetratricopeptide (TPR) repeat protein